MIPLGFIFMCASFNLVILQNLRDSIVVTAAGAEVLPFLASYCVLPSSLLFLAFYTRLCSTQQPRHIFYMAITPLLGMYVLFATLLFPASGHLHLPWLTASAASFLPTGLMGAVKVVENWTFSLFFCAAELWGTVVISVLFWTLANEVCTVDEAKTAYPLMGMSANLALIMSGSYIKWVNSGPAAGGIGASLNWLVGTIVVSSGVMCIAKHLIDRSGYISSNAQGAKNSSQETPGSAKATRKRKRGSFR